MSNLTYSNEGRIVNGSLNGCVKLGDSLAYSPVSDGAGGGAAKARASRRNVLATYNKLGIPIVPLVYVNGFC